LFWGIAFVAAQDQTVIFNPDGRQSGRDSGWTMNVAEEIDAIPHRRRKILV
jgi:hypothetical protein